MISTNGVQQLVEAIHRLVVKTFDVILVFIARTILKNWVVNDVSISPSFRRFVNENIQPQHNSIYNSAVEIAVVNRVTRTIDGFGDCILVANVTDG